MQLVDGEKLKIVRVDSIAKFSADTYTKIPVNGAKGLLRLLCFEPNQLVPLHKHPKADEYFFVIKGKGKVKIGTEETDAESGYITRAPAGIAHQWRTKSERLILLSVLVPPSNYKLADEAVKMEFT
jgi:quercetin dioxygenase-like cupin family protein